MQLLTLARDLRRRKARERQGLFVAEGVRTVEELLASGLRVRGALVAPGLATTPRGRALRTALEARRLPILEVDDRDFASAADTESPQGVLAVADQPVHALDALPAAPTPLRLLVLDGIQDPGNAGTLLRTAAALGVDAVAALPGTVDLWSAKVVRGAMGAGFRLPTLTSTADALAAFLRDAELPLWGADGAGDPVDAGGGTTPARLALALGNEGAGLSAALRARAERLIAIPSTGLVESLNVAVAGAILLWELRPAPLRRTAAPARTDGSAGTGPSGAAPSAPTPAGVAPADVAADDVTPADVAPGRG